MMYVLERRGRTSHPLCSNFMNASYRLEMRSNHVVSTQEHNGLCSAKVSLCVTTRHYLMCNISVGQHSDIHIWAEGLLELLTLEITYSKRLNAVMGFHHSKKSRINTHIFEVFDSEPV